MVRWRGLKFLSQFGGQVFVVDYGFYGGCRAEMRVGLWWWLSGKLAGGVWVDGGGCGVGLGKQEAVLEELGRGWFFG